MGRKTAASIAKGKEKRLHRKEEQQRINQALAAVAEANKLSDPLEPFLVFRKFSKNGIEAELFVKKCPDVEESVKQWCFNLTKRNMQAKYEQCSWGWNDEWKREELSDDRAWYLVAWSPDGDLLGFSHFRFDLDEGIEVLYCYELQLDTSVQRKGLGKFMMQVLELIAWKNSMKKVVLTVLKNNQYSNFFKNINYELDESSPLDNEEELYPYEILSKMNKRLMPKASTHSHSHSNGHCCSNHHH